MLTVKAIMKSRVVTATEFKAKCKAFLDDVEGQTSTITITRRGRPVAVLVPPRRKPAKSPKGVWVGKVEIIGDIVNPGRSGTWEILRSK